MKNIYWLVRRELWEHKGSMIYTPLAISGLAVALLIVAVVSVFLKTNPQKIATLSAELNRQIVSGEMGNFGDGLIGATSVLLLAIGFLTITFYFLGSLFEDRKDKSIFFWKSLPISDQETVFSKLIVGLVVNPIFLMLLASILFYIVAIVFGLAGVAAGSDLFSSMIVNSNFLTAPFKALALLPIQILWALPTAGWLLLVSAAVKNKPLLWAIGIPLMAAIFIAVAVQARFIGAELGPWLIDNFVYRSFSGFIPLGWFQSVDIEGNSLNLQGNLNNAIAQSYGMLTSTKLWLGGVLGAAMTFAAIELRASNSEI
jgi:ABC-2 type transport system permease protein